MYLGKNLKVKNMNKKLLVITIFSVSLFILLGLGSFGIGYKYGPILKCYIKATFNMKYPCHYALFSTSTANSFKYKVSPVELDLNYKGLTAAVFHDSEKSELTVYKQDNKIFSNAKTPPPKLPNFISNENFSTVLKQVFYHKGVLIGLIGRKENKCLFAALINLETGKELFKAPCVPDTNVLLQDFAAIGGGNVPMDDGFLLTIGTPEYTSQATRDLAQDPNSPYGKIHSFKFSKDKSKLISEIYASGIRNPQGMRKINGKIYSIAHGPRGGDEINIVEKEKNYGWPLVSFGAQYGGKRYQVNSKKPFTDPVYAFIPSIAPSDIVSCPDNLKQYYHPYPCMVISTLRDKSLYLILLNKPGNSVISIEKLYLGVRLREFFTPIGKVKDTKALYVTSDQAGLLKVEFLKFR